MVRRVGTGAGLDHYLLEEHPQVLRAERRCEKANSRQIFTKSTRLPNTQGDQWKGLTYTGVRDGPRAGCAGSTPRPRSRKKKYTLPPQIHFTISFPLGLALGLIKGLKPVHKWWKPSTWHSTL